MDIQLVEASIGDKSAVRNLMELYYHDLSEYSGKDVTDHGLFGYRYLDHYWTEPGRYPWLARVEGKLAGLALVRDVEESGGGTVHVMSEFFVLRKFRRRGVGRRLACRLFDRFPGRWRVEQEAGNHPAQVFWRSVIGEYTKGRFAEIEPGTGGELRGTGQVFNAPPSAEGVGS